MMRVARVVSFVVIGFLAVTVRGEAQTRAATDTSRFTAAVNAGATFGHKSSGTVGAEATYKVMGPLGVFVEGGRMMNAGTEDLDARALKIANAVGATASASYKVNFFDVGVRYTPVMPWTARPYVMFGAGVAHVTADTELAVNGTTVDPATLGIQFGTDLSGSVNKGFVVFGGGATYPLMERYFIDGSLRYGHVMAKTSQTENDQGINTLRLLIGFGVKF
jgi:hypothetical protein